MQLYSALDNASTIIALLSPDYITSQVCQEEYNLALMKHIAAVSSINLVYKREAFLNIVTCQAHPSSSSSSSVYTQIAGPSHHHHLGVKIIHWFLG